MPFQIKLIVFAEISVKWGCGLEVREEEVGAGPASAGVCCAVSCSQEQGAEHWGGPGLVPATSWVSFSYQLI